MVISHRGNSRYVKSLSACDVGSVIKKDTVTDEATVVCIHNRMSGGHQSSSRFSRSCSLELLEGKESLCVLYAWL